MAQYEVAVVGGGLVGAATAYELGARGVRTLLVDRADAGRATDAGAGILSPETTKRDDPDWVALVRAAGADYDELVPKLTGATGWARCGILQLATRAGDVPAWEWVAERAPGATEIEAEEARAMVPVLGDVVRALHHPAAARVDGRLMCAALRRTAVEEFGVVVRDESVDDVRALPAGAVVIVGGAWTGEVARQLGVQLPVGPLRGQIIHLGVDGHDTGAWPIVQPVYGYYMVPWADARVAVGATVEDAGFAADVTAGACTTCCAKPCGSCPASRMRPCARCGSASDRSASTTPRSSARCRRHAAVPTCSSRPATARTAYCSAPFRAHWSPT